MTALAARQMDTSEMLHEFFRAAAEPVVSRAKDAYEIISGYFHGPTQTDTRYDAHMHLEQDGPALTEQKAANARTDDGWRTYFKELKERVAANKRVVAFNNWLSSHRPQPLGKNKRETLEAK